MYLCATISCTCGCEYEIDDKISIDNPCCPNCGKTADYSNEIIKILKIAHNIYTVTELDAFPEHVNFSSDEFRKIRPKS